VRDAYELFGTVYTRYFHFATLTRLRIVSFQSQFRNNFERPPDVILEVLDLFYPNAETN